MLTLSKKSSPPSPPRTERKSASKGRLLLSDDAFAIVAGRRGIKLKLPNRTALLIEPVCLSALAGSVALYALAALLANEWLYLLAASLHLSAWLGIIVPLAVVSSLELEAWLPSYMGATHRAECSIQIRQAAWLGPLRLALPLSFLRLRPVLTRRCLSGWTVSAPVQPLLLQEAGDHLSCLLRMPELERGVYKLSHIDVCTCLPFGFSWAIRTFKLADARSRDNTAVVMPALSNMSGNFLLSVSGMLSSMGMSFSPLRAFSQSISVRGIREFQTGDSLRHIHWPSTARLNRLLVREFESEVLPMYDLHLDLQAPWQDRKQFELSVCLAFSLIHFGFERDMLPELIIQPALNSPELSHLMGDLPTMKTPLEMLGEILARVEPLPHAPARPYEPPGSRQKLLSITPSKQALGHDRQGAACCPIYLTALADEQGGGKVLVATVCCLEDISGT